MVADLPLSGLKVLVTRPEQQAKALSDMVEQLGGDVIRFPVIEIKKIVNNSEESVKPIEMDVMIFVSRNAVDYFFNETGREISASTLVVAVGKGTAEVLVQQGVSQVVQPTQAIGSEGVLMLPELAEVTDKNIAIVRGRGGRELLADTLAARGAKISYIEVYERTVPSPTKAQCKQAASADVVVSTSVLSVTNLYLLLSEDIETILVKPLIVLSERIKQHALSLGFKDVMICADASDQAVIQQLVEMER